MALPVEDYALIGDCRTAALVGRDGSIDWLCLPRFDAPACFAALLGGPEHGHWCIAPVSGEVASSRRYAQDTLILETDFETPTGKCRLTDFMPITGDGANLVRIVTGLEGTVDLRMDLVIRFEYGRLVPWVTRDDGELVAIAGPDLLVLRTPAGHRGEGLSTVSEFSVAAGEEVPFVLTHGPSHLPPPPGADPRSALERTAAFWRDWAGQVQLRRTVARDRGALADHAEGTDLRPHRRHRRGAHHVAAREAGRRAQLGLPLLLAARRHLRAAVADAGWLPRGGQVVACLAGARGGRPPLAAAANLQRYRREPAG